jgi:hypothetical protein
MADDMTDEEYAALDRYLTQTTPELTNIPGVFASQRALLNYLDTVSANYIMTMAEANNQTPAQVIGKMVRHEIAKRI